MLNQLTIAEASIKLAKKEISSLELTQACLDAIKNKDSKVKAFIKVTEEEALAEAKAVDEKLSAGEKLSALSGIPVAIKDVIVTEGIETTASSNILRGYIPPYDATVVARLKEQGAVIIGKTNCDAFAHGASTENSDFFTTRNPWDLDRVPGGSSGGSAASVAASEALYALGTDTGGSIRHPAAYCGVVGFKPTYGRVSRNGLISMTSSTDCIGPIVRTVMDAAIVLNAIAGYDALDATTSKIDVPKYQNLLRGGVKDLKIGVPKEYFAEGLNPEVEKVVKEAIEFFKRAGAEVVDISLPHTKYAVAAYYVITPSELSTNLSRFDGIKYGYSIINDKKNKDQPKNLFEVYTKTRKYGFGDEAKRRIMLGTYSLSSGYYDAYYLQASKVRSLIKKDFDSVFKDKVDIIATPVTADLPFKIGEKSKDPLKMYLEDVFLTAASLTGLPAISLPCGFVERDGRKLPVGFQLIGQYFDEEKLLRAAATFEVDQKLFKEKPEIH